jgi:hypothetical protein
MPTRHAIRTKSGQRRLFHFGDPPAGDRLRRFTGRAKTRARVGSQERLVIRELLSRAYDYKDKNLRFRRY